MATQKYGNWHIEYAPTPIPTRQFDYSFWHTDFGGDGDNRCGHAESVIDAMTQINEIEDEAFECDCTAPIPSDCMALTCDKRTEDAARCEAYQIERARFVVQVAA
jgi:hypothetical protein